MIKTIEFYAFIAVGSILLAYCVYYFLIQMFFTVRNVLKFIVYVVKYFGNE